MTSRKYKKLLMAEGLDRNLAEKERKRLVAYNLISLSEEVKDRKNGYKIMASIRKESNMCSLRAVHAVEALYRKNNVNL